MQRLYVVHEVVCCVIPVTCALTVTCSGEAALTYSGEACNNRTSSE